MSERLDISANGKLTRFIYFRLLTTKTRYFILGLHNKKEVREAFNKKREYRKTFDLRREGVKLKTLLFNS